MTTPDESLHEVVERHEKLVLIETAGSVLWFIMDGLWMLNQALPAKAMVAPTLAVNLWVFRYTRRSLSQIAVVGAMNSWLLMNIFWMIGDLDKNPKPIEVARVLFGAGLLLLLVAVARSATNRAGMSKVLGHFRRLRT